MQKQLLFFCFIIFLSCQKENMNWGIPSTYLPPSTILKNGIVNKYYQHISRNNKTYSSILYRTYKTLPSDHLVEEIYDVEFELYRKNVFQFKNDKMYLINQNEYITADDTINISIEKPILNDWKNQVNTFKKTTIYPTLERRLTVNQTQNTDATIDNKKAKIFNSEGTWNLIFDENTSISSFTEQKTYVEGLGLYQWKYQSPDVDIKMELVEQISLTEFHKMKAIERNRIAYIDPKKVMDNNSSFKTCNSIESIMDYYNFEENMIYEGGKKEIRNTVNQYFDKNKIHSESGYLTFRFVINCEGEMGRIITEESDLDFQAKKFHTNTKQHFLEITQQLSHWKKMANRRAIPSDYYTYITYKLENGELIEILP